MQKKHSAIWRKGMILGGSILWVLALCMQAGASLEPVYARHAMVAAPEAQAAAAGLEILRQGGNAFDAAVAVGFALAVTYPAAGNLGGGGFLTALTAEGKPMFLDFRETAPQSATRDMYLDAAGRVIIGDSTDSYRAVGVPGTVHGLLRILEDHGILSRRQVLASAIRLAEKGFLVSHSLHESLADSDTQKQLIKYPATRRIFYPNGSPLGFGDRLQQPDLAKTLQRIRRAGVQGFYEGETAKRLAAAMRAHGGLITEEDLRAYRSVYRDPIELEYKDYHLILPAPPSSGGVTMGQILKLVEPLPLAEMGFNSARYANALAEAERLAFADRNVYLGDPDFVKIPLRGLLSPKYLDARRRTLPLGRAGVELGAGPGRPEAEETTHFCVVDPWRNVAAITYTLNGGFGMGAVVDGAGFFLNNEMDDFSASPGQPNMFGLTGAEANDIAPGKRMLSSMAPTIVTRKGQFFCTFGTPGGPTILTTNVQIFLNLVEFGMNIREAIAAPRFHHQGQPDKMVHESFAFSQDTIERLQQMGYVLQKRSTLGMAAGIQSTEEGWLAGYADGRGEGVAVGE